MVLMLIFLALLVAFANGANDNAKGVAPLIGGGVAPLRTALRWANLTTLLGSLSAIGVALMVNRELIKAFGGGGLLPAGHPVTGAFLGSVAAGAALTVLLATRIGIPVSTTHALTGALLGAGLIAVGPDRLGWAALGKRFLLPLLLSPALSAVGALALYAIAKGAMKAPLFEKRLCLCVEQTVIPVLQRDGSLVVAEGARVLTVDEASRCEMRYTKSLFSVSVQRMFTAAHYLAAGLVSFARGMNDAPKIVGLLVAAGALHITSGLALISLAMLAGGLLFTRRVARTMSEQITPMDGEQALAATVITSILVLLASWRGLPVSTTHVAVGSLFGIGLAGGTARWRTLGSILAAWITTLPLAGALAALFLRLSGGGT